jgi:hypothetical protein
MILISFPFTVAVTKSLFLIAARSPSMFKTSPCSSFSQSDGFLNSKGTIKVNQVLPTDASVRFSDSKLLTEIFWC